jgi:hypothetical protein
MPASRDELFDEAAERSGAITDQREQPIRAGTPTALGDRNPDYTAVSAVTCGIVSDPCSLYAG